MSMDFSGGGGIRLGLMVTGEKDYVIEDVFKLLISCF